ncbi:TonB family protein [Microvirga sp. RSM25]|uniref:energy transducer TonB family protein n=1 Tax=Microvirga sp. RSM25 TaxID=3273802 RepID=UPI00384AE235
MSVLSLRSTQEPSRLGIAFITALILHGAALTAVTLWPSDTADTPGEQEITIDLAPAMEEPVSVAPSLEQSQEVQPVETEPLPVETGTVEEQPPEEIVEAQPQEVTEAVPVEALQVEQETAQTEAVILPPSETVVAKPLEEKPAPKPEKKPPPKPVERKPPARRAAEQKPLPSDARQGQASASRENTSGQAASADPNARNRYLASLAATLRNRLRYPDVARSQGVSGVAQIRFTVDRSGRIVSSSLVRSAGHPALDQAALSTASPGSSVPPVPDFIPQLTFTIPLRFNLR